MKKSDKIRCKEVGNLRRDKTTTQIGLRVTEDLKNRLEERASEEGRTLSNLVIKICEDYLKRIEEAKKTLNS